MALMEVSFFSNVLGMTMSMNVIIPQQTQTQIGLAGTTNGKTYPTLYLLHGMSDDHSIWLRRTAIERYVSELGIAVVMPTTHLGWYTDTTYGLKYWQFISEELPAICREFFPRMSTKREDTFVAGLSMGGYGAFKLGLAKPEIFGAVASLSGALDIQEMMKTQNINENDQFWRGIFGPLKSLSMGSDDLLYLAETSFTKQQKLPRFYSWCGTEDFLYQNNLGAEVKLRQLGVPVEAHYSTGDHQWSDWDEQIQAVLAWLMARTN